MGIAVLNVVRIANIRTLAGIVLAVLLLGASISTAAPRAGAPAHRRVVTHRPPRTKKLAKAGGWAGAGLVAGRAAGPAGSAVVGAAKYRKDLKAGGKRRNKAVAKIGAPIAAGAVAGPAGSAGVEAVEHRKWIKHQILRVKPHKSHGA
jgi:hypothetical protein